MSIDDQELRALHFLALRVRRATSGAGPWDADGLMTNLRKIADRNLHLTVEHVLRHAADPNAKTPGVIVGSFTPEAPKATPKLHPPKKADECRHHPGQYPPPYCGPCATEGRAWGDDQATPTSPADREASLAACREALRGETT